MNDSRQQHWRRDRDEGMDADIAERLLNGEDIETSDGVVADLAKVLVVAAEPLSGRPEDARAALALFRKESHERYERGGQRANRKAHLAVVISGVAAAALTLGGVVVAAENSAHSHTIRPASSTPGPKPSAPVAGISTQAPRTHRTPRPASSASGASSTRSTSGGAGTARTPTPPPLSPSPPASTDGSSTVRGLKGLCEAYAQSTQRGQALNAPSQERLDQAAGGSDHVDAYCAQLTGAAAGHGKSPTTHLAAPTSRGRGSVGAAGTESRGR